MKSHLFKRITAILLAVAVIFTQWNIPFAADAATGDKWTEDGINYEENSDGANTVSIIGHTTAKHNEISTHAYTVPESVEHNGTTYTVTAIRGSVTGTTSDSANNGLASIQATTITIPDSIIHIGDYAFQQCNNTNTINIGLGVKDIGIKAFLGCTTLTSIDIPKNVTSVGESAFENAVKAQTITFAEGSTASIGDYCFRMNNPSGTVLANAKLPVNGTKLGKGAFYNCKNLINVNLPKGLTAIEENTFYRCESLRGDGKFDSSDTSIEPVEICGFDLPINLTSIGDYAFYMCGKIKYMDFYTCTKLAAIGNHAFDSCDSLLYTDFAEHALTIGDYAFNNCSALQYINLAEGLTSIGQFAFYNCAKLGSLETAYEENGVSYNGVYKVIIPSTTTAIGDSAFAGCKKLWQVEYAEKSKLSKFGTGVFMGCSNLDSATFPEGCFTVLPASTFQNCTSLGTVHLPSNLTAINAYAFSYAALTNLESNDRFAMLESLGEHVFEGCHFTGYDVPKKITSIPKYAFNNCDQLEDFNWGESKVTFIGEAAFAACEKLRQMYIPATVAANGLGNGIFMQSPLIGTTDSTHTDGFEFKNAPSNIPAYMFAGCTSLPSITIPESVTKINAYAFSGCDTLPSVTIPNAVTSIESYAFGAYKTYGNLSKLTNVYLTANSKLTSIGPSAFANDTNLETMTEPSKLTSIGAMAFSGCSKFKGFAPLEASVSWNTLAIPNTVSVIGKEAFSDCTSIAGLVLPINPQFKKIDESCFENCTGIKGEISIPTSVTVISKNAFAGCNIEQLRFAANVAASSLLGTDTCCFYGLGSGTMVPIYVPDGFEDEYEAALINSKVNEGKTGASWDFKLYTPIATSLTTTSTQTVSIVYGNSLELKDKVNITPTTAYGTIVWKSNNPAIATVDEDGTITAIGFASNSSIGETTITGTVPNTNLKPIEVKVKVTTGTTAKVDNPITITKLTGSPTELIENGTSYKLGKSVDKEHPIFADEKDKAYTITAEYTTSSTTSEDSLREDALIWDTTTGNKGIIKATVAADNNSITFTPLKAGTATITVITYTGEQKTVDIEVSSNITGFKLKSGKTAEQSFVIGTDSNYLNYFYDTLPAGAEEDVRFTTSNAAVASIDEKTGKITAVGIGTCTLAATVYRANQPTAITIAFAVTVTNPITGITLSNTVKSASFIGQSGTINASYTLSNQTVAATDDKLVWDATTSNKDIVSVSLAGNSLTYTALKAGTATIKVTNKSGKTSQSISISVQEPKLTINQSSAKIYTNKKYGATSIQLTATVTGPSPDITWTSSNPNIAPVDANGLVTAKKNGVVTITATANGISKTCTVTSCKTTLEPKLNVGTYKASSKTYTVKKKKTKTGAITAQFNISQVNSQIKKLSFKSSKKSVVSVDKKGNVKIKKKGTAKITVTAYTKAKKKQKKYTKYKATFKIKVK